MSIEKLRRLGKYCNESLHWKFLTLFQSPSLRGITSPLFYILLLSLTVNSIQLTRGEHLYNLATWSSIHQEFRPFSPSSLLSLLHQEESLWCRPSQNAFTSAPGISCRVLGLILLQMRHFIQRDPWQDGGEAEGSSQVHRKLGPHLLVKSIIMWMCTCVLFWNPLIWGLSWRHSG